MKATALIAQLQALVAEHGDDVKVATQNNEYGTCLVDYADYDEEVDALVIQTAHCAKLRW